MEKHPELDALPHMVRLVVEAARPAHNDPLGSYTGVPADEADAVPVQDADDL